MRHKREYRYRSGQAGCTRPSINRLHHLSKIGKVEYIRACAFRTVFEDNKQPTIRLAVIVRGEKGYARYDGFCWGYGGEGPHGLRRLFDYYRIPVSIATHIAHELESPDWNRARQYWKLKCNGDCESYELFVYDKDDNITHHTVYELNPVEAQAVQQLLPV